MTQQTYNSLVLQYSLPNMFVIDFVHDVTDLIITEVNAGEFNLILKNEKHYVQTT